MKQKEKNYYRTWTNKDLISFYKAYIKASKPSQFHLKEKFEKITNILRERSALRFIKK